MLPPLGDVAEQTRVWERWRSGLQDPYHPCAGWPRIFWTRLVLRQGCQLLSGIDKRTHDWRVLVRAEVRCALAISNLC